ncbi:MAG: DNA mismatch repair endonuclease MutL [Proteobacteria bacterium]|nr:DNA mismatch repair endonuclease MutL [Pseudomonadota bacterium]MBU1649994.1 DNA mismatch repair endonuclease MutL [Pseudomonadota bacterium]MBU1986716.1 DNA mismatch repair endonuclease MutL [Pseudomonadota bacterium]
MSKIRILPEQLANRIAAGEVVERPASVVKELLENSLDAGASRIEIEIEGSGTRLIRVMDNGEGMDEDDMLLCLERHGTSKISSAQDLDTINSLGFRGEAIPSIGSVSRMTISSRTQDSALGARVVLDYGKMIKVHEIGCSRGTIFEIRNLFGNTPARRKFLRTNRTELSHIEEVVKNYAVAAPAITFILRIDEREVLHCGENQSLPDRLKAIMHYQGPFMEIGKAENNNQHSGRTSSVHGYLLPPDAAVAGSAGIRLLVNGRAVRDRMIVHAVAEGLRNFLMKGRNPAGLIHLRLPLEDVDVNVHPTKQEIRLRNSQAIHQMISQTVEEAMAEYQKKIQSTIFRTEPSHTSPQQESTAQPTPDSSGQQTVRFHSTPKHTPEPFITKAIPVPPSRPYQPEAPQASEPSPRPQPVRKMDAQALLQTAEPTASAAPPIIQPTKKDQHPLPEAKVPCHGLKVIGQYDNLYIFCQSADGGLLVVDQHAAHERLLFEDLKKQFMQGQIAGQTLLFPATVELSIAQTECVEHHADEIKQMGFTVREFGGNSFIISSVPAMAGQCNPGELFLDLLERFESGEDKNGKGSILDDILASMACKAAVKAGDTLHAREIDALLSRMARADLFSHCPHGRPVLKHFTSTEIKKWFHRP